jgi:F-type H+-transporting ATPase subunit O
VLLGPDLVVENRRLGDLSKITEDFLKLTAADRSELSAIVKTAVKLTQKQEKALVKALTAHPSVGAGNAVTMSNVVDSSIVGGLVVEVEDGGVTRVIDLSAKKKLSELKQLLSA